MEAGAVSSHRRLIPVTNPILSDSPQDLAALNATVQDILMGRMEHRQIDVTCETTGRFDAWCACGRMESGRTMGGATANLMRFHIGPETRTPTCPQCHRLVTACGYDADNDICPEYERFMDERVIQGVPF